jgi:hypothetical protein
VLTDDLVLASPRHHPDGDHRSLGMLCHQHAARSPLPAPGKTILPS